MVIEEPRNIKVLHKWVKYVEERAQELNYEVENISEVYENHLESMMSVKLASNRLDQAYRLVRIELHIESHSAARIRMCLIQNIYLIAEERPFCDMEESMKESIELLFKKIK